MQVRTSTLLVLANVALLGVTAYHLSAGRAVPITEVPLPFGTAVSKDTLQLLTANKDIGSDRWVHLLILFARSGDAATSEALGWLARASARPFVRLAVAIVLDDDDADLSDAIPRRSHIYRVIDREHALHLAFKVAPHHRHGGTIIVNREGHVEFSTPSVLRSDDLRQIYEKYETGTIRYAAVRSRLADVIQLGAPVPNFDARPIDSGGLVTIGAKRLTNAALVVVSAACTACRLSSLIAEIEMFSRELTRQGRTLFLFFVGANPVLIRSALGPERTLRRRSFTVEASSTLGPGTDTRFSDLDRPLVVYTDAHGRVERTLPLPVQ